MSFYKEFDNFTLGELIFCFQNSPISKEENPWLYYSELAFLIKDKGQKGIIFLTQEIPLLEKIQDGVRLASIFMALTGEGKYSLKISERLFANLQNKQECVIVAAVDGLSSFSEKKALDRVFPLLKHPSPYVQGAVLRFMANLYPERAWPLLIEALKHPHYIVRENGVDELDNLCDAAAIPYIRPLLNDPHPHVRQAAETAIENLEWYGE